MPIVAVEKNGGGVIGKVITTVKPGTGLVLVNINSILAQYDTQYSGRTAAHAAANYTRMNLSNWDVIYTMVIDAQVVEGPSAGGAI